MFQQTFQSKAYVLFFCCSDKKRNTGKKINQVEYWSATPLAWFYTWYGI